MHPQFATKIPTVTLDVTNQKRATVAGHFRFLGDKYQKWNRQAGDHTIKKEIAAVGAEIACGIAIRQRWVFKPRPDPEGDLHPGTQVRYTHHPNGHLILHPDDGDKLDHRFYLVTGIFPRYIIHGSIICARGVEIGTRKQFQKNRPCLAVSQSLLEKVDPAIHPLKQFEFPVIDCCSRSRKIKQLNHLYDASRAREISVDG